jgi:hypothetical protein
MLDLITQQNLDLFKAQHPNNPAIQALTLDDVITNTAGSTVVWSRVLDNPPPLILSRMAFFGSNRSWCDIDIAKVVIDVVLLAIDASELSGKLSQEAAEEAAAVLGEDITEIEELVNALGKASSNTEKAAAIFAILRHIVDIGCLGGILSAIFKSLSWWDMILYGIVAVVTIVALVVSDGALAIIGLLISAVFLFEDVKTCITTCSNPNPPPGPPGVSGLRTIDGHFMTVVNGGAVGDDDSALNSDRVTVGIWETFTVVPIDYVAGTFALRCYNGQYLTAINGGGIGGPDNHNSPCHTNATSIGDWEQIKLVPQENGTYAISTYAGYWITAVNGGGWPQQPKQAFRTDTPTIGPWETFALVQGY